jgi:hypothetical protein
MQSLDVAREQAPEDDLKALKEVRKETAPGGSP